MIRRASDKKKSGSGAAKKKRMAINFEAWCAKNPGREKIDKKKEEELYLIQLKEELRKTMVECQVGSKACNKFRKHLVRDFEKACQRADKLVKIIKIRLPMPMSFDSSWDCFTGQSWNKCIGQVIIKGRLPEEILEKKSESMLEEACRIGWNEARKELEKEFSHCFSKGSEKQ